MTEADKLRSLELALEHERRKSAQLSARLQTAVDERNQAQADLRAQKDPKASTPSLEKLRERTRALVRAEAEARVANPWESEPHRKLGEATVALIAACKEELK